MIIESSVLSQISIDELFKRSQSKSTHIGTNYYHINIYKILPNGICLHINNVMYVFLRANWYKYPPTEDEILNSVDFLCTDSGKGGTIVNFNTKYYKKLQNYFQETGYSYNHLEIIPTLDGKDIISLNLSKKTQKCITNTGILFTTIKGQESIVNKFKEMLNCGYIYKDNNTNTNIEFDNDIIEFTICTPFWEHDKSDVIKFHYKLLKKVITNEINISITEFMKYKNLSEHNLNIFLTKINEIYNIPNSDLSLKNYIKEGEWPYIIYNYCQKDK
jgi:hypothetical protein